MPSLKNIVTPLIEEQSAIEKLSLEIEQVLKYYEEHPQYPLDYKKIRQRIREVNIRLSKLKDEMQRIATINI